MLKRLGHDLKPHYYILTTTAGVFLSLIVTDVRAFSQQSQQFSSSAQVASKSQSTRLPDTRKESASFPWPTAAKPRAWKYIVIHHSATTRGSVESIHQDHRRRKDATGNNWLGIGYHFVIGNGHGMKDGSIDSTFRWKQQIHGAHSGSVPHNGFGIGICLIGNFENTAPTPKQTAAVTRLLRLLSVHYKLKREQVLGHKRIKPTACPGRLFPMRQIMDDAFPNSSQAKGVRSDSFRTSRSTHGS